MLKIQACSFYFISNTNQAWAQARAHIQIILYVQVWFIFMLKKKIDLIHELMC